MPKEPSSTLKLQIGQRLRLTRQAIGKPRGEFLTLLGVSTKTLSRWETGQDFPAESFVVDLYEHFGVSADWIYNNRLSSMPDSLASKIREKMRGN